MTTDPFDAEPGNRETLTRRLAEVMRSQTRRSWSVPLLAVPTVNLLDTPGLKRATLGIDGESETAIDQYLGPAREAIRAVAAGERALSDEDAPALVMIALSSVSVLGGLFPVPEALEASLGVPEGLGGEALVSTLSRRMRIGPEDPSLLMVVMWPILSLRFLANEDYALLPVPGSDARPLATAVDARCFALGMRTWEDAIRHGVNQWTDTAWRNLLVRAGAAMTHVANTMVEPADEGAPVRKEKESRRDGAKPKARARQARELQGRLTALEAQLETERQARATSAADAAATRLREAELIQARDRAVARAGALEERTRAAEATAREQAGLIRALQSDLRRQSSGDSEDEPAEEVDLTWISPGPILAGRLVYLFTGQTRGAASQAMANSLEVLGPAEVRAYTTDQGGLGPESFPENAVVVVDVRFLSHSDSGTVKTRAVRSGAKVFLLRCGSGSLAREVAERFMAGS